MTEKEIKILKERYDEHFQKYWSKPDGSTKFNPISLDEFKKRLSESETFLKKFGKL